MNVNNGSFEDEFLLRWSDGTFTIATRRSNIEELLVYILVKFHQFNHKKLRYNLVCQKDELVVDKSNMKSIIEYSVNLTNSAREIKLSSIFMNKICITILLNLILFFCKSVMNYFIDELKSLFTSNRMIMKDKEI